MTVWVPIDDGHADLTSHDTFTQGPPHNTFARLRHRSFPGGRLLRTPALVLGMAYYRLRDAL